MSDRGTHREQPKHWPPDQTNKEEYQSEHSSRGKAAAAVRAELQRHGIGEPALTRLADHPGLTPELVRATVDRTRRDGGRNGLLVRRLEEAAAAAVHQETEQARAVAAATARDEATERTRRAQAEQLETIEGERQKRAAIIEALSPDELARLTADVLANAAPIHRDRWRKADPRTNVGLQIAICDRWRREQEGSAARPADDRPEAGAPDNGPDRPAEPSPEVTGG